MLGYPGPLSHPRPGRLWRVLCKEGSINTVIEMASAVLEQKASIIRLAEVGGVGHLGLLAEVNLKVISTQRVM